MPFTTLDKFKIPLNDLKLTVLRSVTPDTTLDVVLDYMCEQRIGSVLVEEKSKVVGLITESDFFMKVIGKVADLKVQTVSSIMTETPLKLTQKSTLFEYMNMVANYGHRYVPLCWTDRPQNTIITVKKLRDYIFNIFPEEVSNLGTGQLREFFDNDENKIMRQNVIKKYGDDILMAPIHKLLLVQVPSIPPTTFLQDAIPHMQEHGIKSLLITKNEKLYGILTMMDILIKVLHKKLDLRDIRIENVMTKHPAYLYQDDVVAQIVNNMYIGNYRNLPIVNLDLRPVGIVTMKEITKYIVEHFNNKMGIPKFSHPQVEEDNEDSPPPLPLD